MLQHRSMFNDPGTKWSHSDDFRLFMKKIMYLAFLIIFRNLSLRFVINFFENASNVLFFQVNLKREEETNQEIQSLSKLDVYSKTIIFILVHGKLMRERERGSENST